MATSKQVKAVKSIHKNCISTICHNVSVGGGTIVAGSLNDQLSQDPTEKQQSAMEKQHNAMSASAVGTRCADKNNYSQNSALTSYLALNVFTVTQDKARISALSSQCH